MKTVFDNQEEIINAFLDQSQSVGRTKQHRLMFKGPRLYSGVPQRGADNKTIIARFLPFEPNVVYLNDEGAFLTPTSERHIRLVRQEAEKRGMTACKRRLWVMGAD